MAETKTKAKKAKSKAKPKAPSKAAQSTKSAAKSSSSKAKSGAKSAAATENGHGSADAVKDAVKSGTHAVGPVARKAALPLLATGAAAAGAAAVIVGKNGQKQRKVLGVKLPKGSKAHLPKIGMPKVSLPKGKGLKGDVRKAAGAVTEAAEKADLIGKRISQVASSVQAVGHATDDAAKKS